MFMERQLERLRRRQNASLGYLLIRAGQRLNDLAIERVNADGPVFPLRAAHTRLFPYLARSAGIGVTDLAAQLGVTKQAIQPLVADLVRAGFLRQRKDPNDRRAKRLFLTEAGVAAMHHGTGVLEEVERLLGLPERRRTALVASLRALNEALDGVPGSSGDRTGSISAPATTPSARR